MGKFLGTFLKILTSLVLLGVVMVLALAFLVDPGKYRPALQHAVLTSTGLELNIAGDMSLTFSPYIGVMLEDVRVRNPGINQELASFSRISLRADPWRLLRGTLTMEELTASGMHINLYVSADGTGSWQTADPESQGPEVASEAGEEAISAAFRRVTIADASLDIQNSAQGYHYTVRDLNLTGTNGNLQFRPFPLATDFTLVSHPSEQVMNFNFSSNASIDYQAGNLSLDGIMLSLTPLLLQGQLAVTDFRGTPQYTGSLNSNTFDPVDLLQNMGVVSAPDNAAFLPERNAIQRELKMRLDFSGDRQQLTVNHLTATLDDREFDLEAEVRFPRDRLPMNINYRLDTNALLFADTPAASEPAEIIASPGDEQDVPVLVAPDEAEFRIPTDLLSSMNVQGSVGLESLTAGALQFGPMDLFTNLENGVLDIEARPVAFYDGQLEGSVRLNGRQPELLVESRFSLSDVNVGHLLPELTGFDPVEGLLDAEMSHTAAGNTRSELLDSLAGSTTFTVEDNSVNFSLIKQVFTTIAALSPTGEAIQQWPDVVEFERLVGFVLLENGLASDQIVNVSMDNFDMTGQGGINREEQSFGYDFLFTVMGEPLPQTIPVSERYHGMSWPVRCAANFDSAINQYCRPEFNQVRDLFAQLSRDEAGPSSEPDQAPEDDQDDSGGFLRDLFR
ncbi:MAG: AsmA family protein [Pseudohongiellaceae bacterium]